jgi:hypothetical protein
MNQEIYISFVAPAILVLFGLGGYVIFSIYHRRVQREIDRDIAAGK